MVALCGEFPADQLTRLIPSPSYGEKLITELKAQKLLRTHYRDHLRGYRLTGRAKQMLLAQNPERFRDFLTGNTETNQVRSEVTRRQSGPKRSNPSAASVPESRNLSDSPKRRHPVLC